MAELLVRGRAEGRLEPSHATFDVTVEAREPASQQAALDRAAAACALVDDTIRRGREGADPLVRTAETSSIRTAENWEYGSGGQRRRLGWVAERRTRMECAPVAEGLTALVRELAHNDIRVSGPQWHAAAYAPGWDDLRKSLKRRIKYGGEASGLIAKPVTGMDHRINEKTQRILALLGEMGEEPVKLVLGEKRAVNKLLNNSDLGPSGS